MTALGAVLTLAVGASAQQPASARKTAPPPAPLVKARVDSLAQAFVATGGAPGISVQVVRGRDTLVAAGYGMADLEDRTPAGASTVYRIGSITKQFTAAGVMRLVEQGKLSLDDSIGARLPDLPQKWRAVTIRQLLNHTSGIPSYTNVGPRWIRRWGENMPPDTLVALTARDSMWFAPGTQWRYDNSGYVVLGMLLERMTGEPYASWIESKLVRPLGLQHTFYCDAERIIAGRARGYEREADGWRNATYLSMSQPYAAGALCSTVGDLARWNVLLATGRVVSAASYKAMTTPVGAAQRNHYGFGLGADSLAGHYMIGHGGGINGFNTDNAYFPDDSLSVTVLTNSGASRPGPLLQNIARTALGLPLVGEPPRASLTTEERRRYAGRYEIQNPDHSVLPVAIIAGERTLMAQPQGQPVSELIPMGNHVFRADFDPNVRVTFRLDNGKATGFTLQQGGLTLDAPRVGDLK